MSNLRSKIIIISKFGKTLFPNKDYTAEEYNSLSYNQKGSLRRARVGRLHDSNDSFSTIDTRTIRATIVNEMRDYFSGNNNMNQNNVIPNEPNLTVHVRTQLKTLFGSLKRGQDTSCS